MALLNTDFLSKEINDENTDADLRECLCLINKDITDKVIGNLVVLNSKPRLGIRNNIYVLGGANNEIMVSIRWPDFTFSVYESALKFNTMEK